jgi:hypothetical protein
MGYVSSRQLPHRCMPSRACERACAPRTLGREEAGDSREVTAASLTPSLPVSSVSIARPGEERTTLFDAAARGALPAAVEALHPIASLQRSGGRGQTLCGDGGIVEIMGRDREEVKTATEIRLYPQIR